mmetsp:Transcript_19138/g.27819  ORF Transcript_19138/g.27819 Transcript_19138/m.27819 type:complete len:98 (+) Transcript_19138:5415-5708(+)
MGASAFDLYFYFEKEHYNMMIAACTTVIYAPFVPLWTVTLVLMRLLIFALGTGVSNVMRCESLYHVSSRISKSIDDIETAKKEQSYHKLNLTDADSD